MDIQKEREAFETWLFSTEKFKFRNKNFLFMLDEYGNYEDKPVLEHWETWQAAKAQAVPEVAQRQGGYYIRDLRSQPGNCMKFWYQAGYGTKHKNFFWCATLEEAKEYKGSCGWFEIWHAPYIDSLVEYTVDFQLADRGVGLVDLKAQEPTND